MTITQYILGSICLLCVAIIGYALCAISSRGSREEEEQQFLADAQLDEEAWRVAEREWPKLKERLKDKGYLKD